MLFGQDELEAPRSQNRIVYIYENRAGSNKLLLELKLSKKKTTFAEICKILGCSKLRLFNSQGDEYYEEDLQYVKDKTTLYASKGEDFDPSSSFGEYNIIKELGEGGFGKVLLAQHKISKQKFAIKTIKTEAIGSAADIDSIFVEAEILKGLRHDNIVKVYNCLTLQNMQMAIIMEYLEGGELLAYVEKKGRIQEDEAKIFFKQMVKAMFYCHQNSLIHRDLKLQNLLLVNNEQKKIKIIDFGIAGVVSNFKIQDIDTGTMNYMAPECFFALKDRKIDGGVDIWAMGVILFGMLVGDLPFKGNTSNQKIQQIKAASYKIPHQVVNELSEECLDALKRCLDPNPRTRIKIAELLMHPWCSDMVFPQVKPQKPKQKKENIVLAPIQEKQHKDKEKKVIAPLKNRKSQAKNIVLLKK